MWNCRAAIREERGATADEHQSCNDQSITVTSITNSSDIDSSLWGKNTNPSDSKDVNILWFLSSLTKTEDRRNYRRFIDQTDWSTITIIISCIVSRHFSLMKLKNFQVIFKPFYQLTALYLYTRIYWILLFHFITLNQMFLSDKKPKSCSKESFQLRYRATWAYRRGE